MADEESQEAGFPGPLLPYPGEWLLVRLEQAVPIATKTARRGL